MSEIPSFDWHQADTQAIAYRPDLNAWRAGIVKDILLTTGGNVLVAAQSGGVWSVSEGGAGICILDSDRPDMWCLAQGTLGDDHCFAGGDTLFETDVSDNLPLLSWIDLDPRDGNGRALGPVFRVVVLPRGADRGHRCCVRRVLVQDSRRAPPRLPRLVARPAGSTWAVCVDGGDRSAVMLVQRVGHRSGRPHRCPDPCCGGVG